MGFGVPELILIFLIILVFFGASRLPILGKGLGEGIRNFKRGVGDRDKLPPKEDDDSADDP